MVSEVKPESKLTPESPFPVQGPGASQNININQMYWRMGLKESRPGWLIVGPGPETSQATRWEKGGREPLPHLSVTDRVSGKTGIPERIEQNADKLATSKFYWLFVNGGAKEFPIEQIVALHWHIDPPFEMTTDVFPQLKKWNVPEPLWCHICPAGRAFHNSPAQLIVHGQISHSLNRKDAQALLETAREKPAGTGGLAPVLTRKSESPEEVAERKAFAADAIEEAGDINVSSRGRNICDSCGTEYDGDMDSHHC